MDYDDRFADMLASAVAQRIASQQRASASRVNISALASAVAHRLGSSQRVPASSAAISALASAVARRIVSQRGYSLRGNASAAASASSASISALASAVAHRLVSQRGYSAYAPAGPSPASADMLASAIARRIVEGTPQSELVSRIGGGGPDVEAIADLVVRHLTSARAVVASAQGNFAETLTNAVAQRLESSGATASADAIERMADAVALAIQLTANPEQGLPAQDIDVTKVVEGNTTEEQPARPTGPGDSGAGKSPSSGKPGRTSSAGSGGGKAGGSSS